MSDYTGLVAGGLADQGDDVHVWCSPCADPNREVKGVTVHRDLGALSPADLRRVSKRLDQFPAPRRLLVQWVPHAFGYRSMNVGFCAWLWNRAARHGDQVEVMAHEAYLPFGRSWKQTAAALVHRLMTILLLRAAERVWMSIPQWEERWLPYALGRQIHFRWLPIPSTIPVINNPRLVDSIRQRYVPAGTMLIGHFGTHGWPITPLLESVLVRLGEVLSGQSVLLMGVGSKEFREELIRRKPNLSRMINATGALSARDLSAHAAACDLLIQPYPDGVSSRRTSVMLGLSHGKAVITTAGKLTESLWSETGVLALAPVGDADAFVELIQKLSVDPAERHRMGQASRKLYEQKFDVSHTIEALRGSAALEHTECAS